MRQQQQQFAKTIEYSIPGDRKEATTQEKYDIHDHSRKIRKIQYRTCAKLCETV